MSSLGFMFLSGFLEKICNWSRFRVKFYVSEHTRKRIGILTTLSVFFYGWLLTFWNKYNCVGVETILLSDDPYNLSIGQPNQSRYFVPLQTQRSPLPVSKPDGPGIFCPVYIECIQIITTISYSFLTGSLPTERDITKWLFFVSIHLLYFIQMDCWDAIDECMLRMSHYYLCLIKHAEIIFLYKM